LYTQGIPRLNIKTTTNPVKVGVNQASSEEKLVTNMGLQYLRIPVPDYHPPSPAQVDQFLNFKKTVLKLQKKFTCQCMASFSLRGRKRQNHHFHAFKRHHRKRIQLFSKIPCRKTVSIRRN